MNDLTVISYNIWFEETLQIERIAALLTVIINFSPDVLCLQEVRPRVYEILINQLKNYKYHFPNKIDELYGCAILSKFPISKGEIYPFYNSQMGRNLIVGIIDYPYHKKEKDAILVEKLAIPIVTTHFESIFKRNVENKAKIEQFEETHIILDELYLAFKNVIFCSDTNILPQEEVKFFANKKNNDWIDAWHLLGNKSNEYTYDGNRNIYLQLKNSKFTSRLDRIIFRCDHCEVIEFRMLDTLEDVLQPSDHFGIMAKFDLKFEK